MVSFFEIHIALMRLLKFSGTSGFIPFPSNAFEHPYMPI
jgi:hypothetical protein